MDEKPVYGEEDCIQTGTGMFIAGYVAVIKPEALPKAQLGIRQLLFCEGGWGSGTNPMALPCTPFPSLTGSVFAGNAARSSVC